MENTAKLNIEAYLVDNLRANLLIGSDVAGLEGFRIDLEIKQIRIASCMGVTFLVVIHAKPNYKQYRDVYNVAAAKIPLYSNFRILIATEELP